MPNRLERIRRRFLSRITKADDYVSRSSGARHSVRQRSALNREQIEWAYETSFLKMMVASEQFFEATFGLYVMGEKAPSGYRPRRKIRLNLSLPQVLLVFRGDRDYVGWNDASTMIRRAEKWLKDGEPFRTALGGAAQPMQYLTSLRNVIAHESDTAQDRFLTATRRLYGSVPPGATPGGQLSRQPPSGVPYLTGTSLFEAVGDIYRALAAQLVP